LKKSLLASVGAAIVLGFEERTLMAKTTNNKTRFNPSSSSTDKPKRKINDVEISRIINGGNLFGGGAHAKDLFYISSLMRNYFTEEKIIETLLLYEENGINSWVMGPSSAAMRFMKKYWNERGGNIQWLTQLCLKSTDMFSSAKRAVDNGAVGGFVMGSVGDR